MTVHAGALEARRWAGLVVAAGPDDGIAVHLAFTDPRGRRRELDDWHWMVSRVGPHAPDGSYARMEFDLAAQPSPESTPSASTLILEWSRRDDAVALRAVASTPGRLELVGDAPWDWKARWEEVTGHDSATTPGAGRNPHPTVWQTALKSMEIATAFTLEPDQRLAAVIAWGAGPAARARSILPEIDPWIDEARAEWGRRRPRSPAACPDLFESIHDNLMWTVLLQPETGRLYTPAGRRWIFPRPARKAPRAGVPETGAPSASTGTRASVTEDGSPKPDDWTVFGWDSFFNALELATVSGDLAWATLLAGTKSRYPNGNIPNWRSRRGGTPDRSQPPIGSFAALKLHQLHPNRDALATTYPHLLSWNTFWVTERKGRPRREGLTPGLLSWGSDTELVPGPDQVPPWEAGASGHQRAAWESGQDDLPLWDEAEWDPDRQILAMSAVDLCSYRALDLECLSRIARLLGDNPTADRLDAERGNLVTTMNRVLWSEDDGLYLDELPSGHSTRVAASNFLPLVAGVPSPRRAARMIDTLRDPSRFWGEWVLPTISRDDPAFKDQQYWRGSIWPPMNYLVLQGLRRYGFNDLADDLAWKGARMFLADHRRTGFCRENFDSRTGKGCGQRFQSWAPLFALGALEQLNRTTRWLGR
ncbi:MAG: trehalase family glycosidase [Gemmatimonadetes bacterium]|nr:trehalase family glycosidase [Gemmatimonadota bacterium]